MIRHTRKYVSTRILTLNYHIKLDILCNIILLNYLLEE